MMRVPVSRAAVVAMALCCVAGLSGALATAQTWARTALDKSPRHTEYVVIDEPNGRKLQAFVAYPEVKEKAPVIVLVHEIFGESDWFKEMADELAGAGYIVVAPDLLSGLGPNTAAKQTPGVGDDHMDMTAVAPGSAYQTAAPGGTHAFPDQGAVIQAVTSLPDAQVIGDLDAAADYAKKLPSSNSKLFVVGFCWGGGKSFLFATHRHDLSGAFVFYGPPPPADAMKNITAPVYGFYAGNDARIGATVPQTEIDMKAAHKVYEPVTYDDAGHGFMRAGEAPDASASNAAARKKAFQRMVKLLGGAQ